MPWGAAAGLAASVAGSAISSAMAPSPSGGGSGYYTPTGLGTADQTWQQLLQQQVGNQAGINNLVDPYYQNSLQSGFNTILGYSPNYQGAADQAGGYYTQLGGQLGNAANTLFTGAGNIYQNAFDPQSALYNRTVQQLQDQTGATNSMYGLGSSAAGAGVANQALSNFNIDWQNQQLQRQLQGLQGIGQAYGQAGAIGNASGQATLAGGQLPYQTAQGIAAYPGQLANQYAQGIEQGPLSSASSIAGQIIPYMNYGQGAQAVPYQNAYNNAQAMGGAVTQGISSLGNNPQVQSTLGQAFGGLFGGGSGGYGAQSSLGFGDISSSPYYSGGGNAYGFTMPS